tara:strand:- start:239 stop:598 length:360 start_codon:yes stop_codon:yes gene_type:complete
MKKRIRMLLDQLKECGVVDKKWHDSLLHKESHYFFSEIVHEIVHEIEAILNEDDTDARMFDVSSVQVGTAVVLKHKLTMRELSVLPIYFERTDEIENMAIEDWFTYAEGDWANIIRRSK